MIEIGKQITQRRKSLKISQQDLSEISGISQRTINAVENGKSNPTIKVLGKIADSLGLVITLSERVTHD